MVTEKRRDQQQRARGDVDQEPRLKPAHRLKQEGTEYAREHMAGPAELSGDHEQGSRGLRERRGEQSKSIEAQLRGGGVTKDPSK